ncbi:MAG TPA: response regulator, partial [Actinoplanes sp.]|nr:response regulator [Actinoplanes sp.]
STCGARRRLITVERTMPRPEVPASGPPVIPHAVPERDDDPVDQPAGRAGFPGRPGATRPGNEPVPEARGAGEAGPPSTLVPLPPGRVLLAEDDEVNRTVLKRMINILGVDCDVVRDGAAAVAALLGTDPYDLVLMDMQMPGVDGPEAARRARAAGYRNPILALTATTLPEDREACLAAGMNGYVGKPITLPELRRALEPYLTAPPAPSEDPGPLEEPVPAAARPAEAPPERPDPGDVLSLQQLHDLEEQLEGRELVAMTVGTFLAELDGRRQSMAIALSAGDNHRLGAVAHTLKSSSALLGAQPLAEACARVERMAAAAADPGALEAAVSEVDRTAGATATAMAGYLAG